MSSSGNAIPATATVIRFCGGVATAVYSDAMLPILQALGGSRTVARASHVEPETMPDGSVLWYADMSPSGGPVLTGFRTREAALAGELRWLRENLGL